MTDVVSDAMDVAVSGWLLGVLAALVALIIAFWAFSNTRRRSAPAPSDERIAALEEQVRGLLYRVWMLERLGGRADIAAGAPPGEPAMVRPAAPEPPVPVPVESAPAIEAPVADAPAAVSAEPAVPAPPRIDLEQRIGARWATWVGIVAILFAVGFFLKWSFDNDLLRPGARALLGVGLGAALVVVGLALHRRRDVPFLSAGLTGLGLGVLYLS